MLRNVRTALLLFFIFFIGLEKMNGQCTWSDVNPYGLKAVQHVFKDRFTDKLYAIGTSMAGGATGIYEKIGNGWSYKFPTDAYEHGFGYTFGADGSLYRAQYVIENKVLKYKISTYKNSAWFEIYLGTTHTIDPSSSVQIKKLKFAWDQGSDLNAVYLATYWGDGNKEVTIGKIFNYEYTTIYTNSQCNDCDFAVSPTTGIPHVTARGTKLLQGAVLKYNGTTWEYLGGENITDDYQTGIRNNLAFSSSGLLYFGYTTALYSKLTVKIFNGSTWDFVGIRDFSHPLNYIEDLKISPDGTPYVVYFNVLNESYKNTNLSVTYYKENVWKEHSIITDSGYVENVHLLFEANNDLHVIYDSLKYDPLKTTKHSFDARKIKTISPLLVSKGSETSRPVCLGASEVFNVEASGKNLSYQWYINAGSGYEPLTETSQFIGVNSSQLLVSSVDASLKKSRFQCWVSNGECSDTSTSVSLRIQEKPEISLPATLTVCSGQKTAVLVDAPWFQWGIQNPGETLFIEPTENTRYYLKFRDTNGCGDTTSILAKVLPAPKITIHAPGLSFCAGTEVKLTLSTDAINWQWSNLAKTSEINILLLSDTTVFVSGVSENGCVDTSFITIKTKEALQLSLDGSKTTSCLNKSHLFLDKHYPGATLRWYRDDVLIREEFGDEFKKIDSLIEPAITISTKFFGLTGRNEIVFIKNYTTIQSYNFNTHQYADLFVKDIPSNDSYFYVITELAYVGEDKFIFVTEDERDGSAIHEFDLITMTERTVWQKEGNFKFASAKPATFYSIGNANMILEKNWETQTTKELFQLPENLGFSYSRAQNKLCYMNTEVMNIDLYSISLDGPDFQPVKDEYFNTEIYGKYRFSEINALALYAVDDKLLFYGKTNYFNTATHTLGRSVLFYYDIVTHQATLLNEENTRFNFVSFQHNLFPDNRLIVYGINQGIFRFDFHEVPPFLEVDKAGSYRVVAQASCTENSNTLVVYNECTSVDDIQAAALQVYPNPSNGIVQINSSEQLSSLQVYNVLGELVYTAKVENGDPILNLSSLAEGQYMLKCYRHEQYVFSKKIAIAR